jgi:general secretion pathway protein I
VVTGSPKRTCATQKTESHIRFNLFGYGSKAALPAWLAKAMGRHSRLGFAAHRAPRRHAVRSATAGFTLIEVLVALSVIAVALTAIGALIATTVRGTRSLDTNLMLVETTRAIATALPDRDTFKPGNFSGEMAGHQWRVDVLPFLFTNVDPRLPTPWVPLTVIIRVQSPNGPILQFNTVRLRHREGG